MCAHKKNLATAEELFFPVPVPVSLFDRSVIPRKCSVLKLSSGEKFRKMIKTEEISEGVSGLYDRSASAIALPPLSSIPPPLSGHYPIVPHSSGIMSELHSIGGHQLHNPHYQSPHHHHLNHMSRLHQESDVKPHISYFNRHSLSSGHHPMVQDIISHTHPPTPASPQSNHKPPVNPSEITTLSTSRDQSSTPVTEFAPASTIKYCSSNGLEILPMQSQHTYVIQQCHTSEANRRNDSNHCGSEMEISSHHRYQSHIPNQIQHEQSQEHSSATVSPSSGIANSNSIENNGNQLEVVQYVGVPRKKESISPISSSSCGSTSPCDVQQSLPPDATKKASNTRRPEKPNMSYINMIAMAIKESPDRMLTLNGIYNYLQQK